MNSKYSVGVLKNALNLYRYLIFIFLFKLYYVIIILGYMFSLAPICWLVWYIKSNMTLDSATTCKARIYRGFLFSGSHIFTIKLTVCPGSSDPPQKILNIFASENEVYTIYELLRYFRWIFIRLQSKIILGHMNLIG